MSPAEERFVAQTTLLPWLVAEAVCGEAGRALGTREPYRHAPALAARAVRLYAVNPPFARRLRARGEGGREWLCAFLRHWLAAALQRTTPHLARALPSGFALGAPTGGTCHFARGPAGV